MQPYEEVSLLIESVEDDIARAVRSGSIALARQFAGDRLGDQLTANGEDVFEFPSKGRRLRERQHKEDET